MVFVVRGYSYVAFVFHGNCMSSCRERYSATDDVNDAGSVALDCVLLLYVTWCGGVDNTPEVWNLVTCLGISN